MHTHPAPKLNVWDDNLTEFLTELTALARKHHIGINDTCELYELEQDDYEREFKLTEEGKLEFI